MAASCTQTKRLLESIRVSTVSTIRNRGLLVKRKLSIVNTQHRWRHESAEITATQIECYRKRPLD